MELQCYYSYYIKEVIRSCQTDMQHILCTRKLLATIAESHFFDKYSEQDNGGFKGNQLCCQPTRNSTYC